MKLKDGDLMVASEVAAALGVSVEMVRKLRRQGTLPAVRTVGGWCVYRTRDVKALALRRARAPRQGGKVRRGFVRVPPP
jgi:excisionase family DNA binding protein